MDILSKSVGGDIFLIRRANDKISQRPVILQGYSMQSSLRSFPILLQAEICN